MTHDRPAVNKSGPPQPAWDVALGFPMQGEWTEEDYLELEARLGNRMVELADGCLEVLPRPSLKHQRLVKWMLRQLDDFVVPRKLGETAMAPLPVRLFKGRIREPDIMYFEAWRIRDADRRPLDGADLVMEVPSRGQKNRQRDLDIKRAEYAKAKIPNIGSSIRKRERSPCWRCRASVTRSTACTSPARKPRRSCSTDSRSRWRRFSPRERGNDQTTQRRHHRLRLHGPGSLQRL